MTIRNTFIACLSAAVLLAGCDEWEPVFTFDYSAPSQEAYSHPEANTTIADLKAMYKDSPINIDKDIVIAGQVVSSDRSGNIYRSMYIQDTTGALEIKLGKSGIYNDYKQGQWVYVRCSGLTLGGYNGMVQLGYRDPSGSYETAYMDVQMIIDQHVYKGEIASVPSPKELDETALKSLIAKGGTDGAFGSLVTLRGLTYGAASSYRTDSYKRIFCLVYVDQSVDTKLSSNRVFLSDKTYGVTTWAMSKNLFVQHLDDGYFDDAETGDDVKITQKRNTTDSETVKETMRRNASAATVSQYFSLGSTPVQIRTSGYSKFADTEIPAEVLGNISSSSADGKSIDVTGILTIYNGSAQFTLIDLDGVTVNN